jgi:hypothetical protein
LNFTERFFSHEKGLADAWPFSCEKINMIKIHDDQLPSFTTGSAAGSGTYDIHNKIMNV